MMDCRMTRIKKTRRKKMLKGTNPLADGHAKGTMIGPS